MSDDGLEYIIDQLEEEIKFLRTKLKLIEDHLDIDEIKEAKQVMKRIN